jgi:hypothetical protein
MGVGIMSHTHDQPCHALRIRGGVEYHPVDRRWRLVVMIWKNERGEGEPDDRYQLPQTYTTEAEARAAYATEMRPILARVVADAQRRGIVEIHRWGPGEP